MRPIATVFGCAVIFFIENARADTILVPADYPTIYEALDAAVSGDIVEVAPGTYDQFDTRPAWFGDPVSAVGFLKDGVTLKSSGGAGVTTLRLDTNIARPAILMGESGDFNVSGFTFTGSVADLIAVAVQTPDDQTSSLNLHNCIIGDYGMGDPATHELAIDAYNSDVHIQDCSIENIDSPAAVAVFFSGGHVLVEDTSFNNCSGGGIYLSYLDFGNESLIVKRSSFENNGSPNPPSQAAISAVAFSLIVEDSWIAQNYGGINFNCGRESAGVANITVRNCTFAEDGICALSTVGEFTGNTFYSAFQAIYFGSYLGGSSVVLERNIVSFSTGGPAVEIGFASGGSVTTGCNVFWQNQGGHTQGFSMGPTDLVADPQFCNASALDFTVNAASPCLPWNNNGCGQIGAWGLGCGDVSVEPSSWGQIKALYR